MKTIGLIGGMSWESSVTYYQTINQVVKEQLGGGLHSAKCLLYSVDFQEIATCQAAGDWQKSGDLLAEAASNLERAGADFIVICTNTMHKIVGQIEEKITIPVLHIAEVTAQQLDENGIKKVALLGTKYTMEQDFYKEKLLAHAMDVLIPDPDDRNTINQIIYDELCLGVILEASKQKFLAIIDKLSAKGAQGIILGCTEIGLLIQQADTPIPLFDTTLIHAKKAALYALAP